MYDDLAEQKLVARIEAGSGARVFDRDGRTGVIDEELFAGTVLLAKNDVQLAPPPLVEFAEAAVAIAVEMVLSS